MESVLDDEDDLEALLIDLNEDVSDCSELGSNCSIDDLLSCKVDNEERLCSSDDEKLLDDDDDNTEQNQQPKHGLISLSSSSMVGSDTEEDEQLLSIVVPPNDNLIIDQCINLDSTPNPNSPPPDPVAVKSTGQTKSSHPTVPVPKKDFDFPVANSSDSKPPPSKIIRLTDTGKYNHVKTRLGGDKPSYNIVHPNRGHSVTPWKKPQQLCVSSLSSAEKDSLEPTPITQSTRRRPLLRCPVSNKLTDAKYRPRSISVNATATPTQTVTTDSNCDNSSVFSKRGFSFPARSSFGVAVSQLKRTSQFSLQHLQGASSTSSDGGTTPSLAPPIPAAADKFSLSHLK